MITVEGPFGPAREIEQLDIAVVEQLYRDRCGVKLTLRERNILELKLYECDDTQLRFWRPTEAAGDEGFYHLLSERAQNYYRPWRWEYRKALALTTSEDRLLEIGSGRGYFLKLLENKIALALGLEFNRQAISTKVTRWPVKTETVENVAAMSPISFSVVCSFQVLEHVVNPASFIQASIDCLMPGGLLLYSTPNTRFGPHRRREDAFDLPPHHMNHFSHESYRRIAARYGLKIEVIADAPTYGAFRDPTVARRLSPGRFAGAVRSWADKLRGESGITTFVAMRKPA